MQNQERVNDLIFICERMIEILSKENEALRTHNPTPIKERLTEKTQLSLFYERHMKTLQRNPRAFENIEQDSLDTLRELGKDMQELLDENGRLLKVAMDANRKFMSRVAEAARIHTPQSGTYAPSAQASTSAGIASPVTLNQEL